MPATDMPINLEELLDGIRYPAAKVDIIDYAENNGASEEALSALWALPSRIYRNTQHVNAGLGLIENQPGGENLWSTTSQS